MIWPLSSGLSTRLARSLKSRRMSIVPPIHGNSDRLAFRNGIRQAMNAAGSNFTEQLEQDLAAMKESAEA